MRYNEPLNIKLFKYEDGTFKLQTIIDDYAEISFSHNLYEAGDFTISINYNIPNALKFQRGLFVQIGNDSYMFGEIMKVTDSIGQDGKGSQIRTVTGKDARYIFKRRIIKNLNNEENWVMTAKGELCIRNLISDQCGADAEEKRRLPVINIIPDVSAAVGKEYSVAESYSNLYDTLVTIATQSETGWRIKFDGSLKLECYVGQNLSNQVQFSTDFDSLSNGQFTDSAESFANTIYVGGKGTGSDRDIYEGEIETEGETPEGLERYEAWDNQSSMTSESEYEAEALAMLTQYGQTLNIAGNGLAKSPYVFKKNYNIGDSITIAFSGKLAVAQILSVTEHWTWGQYGIDFSFGKPQNDLSRQFQLILKQIQKASDKNVTTESIKYYTIPTDTTMPKSDVIYDRIGFTGDCGEGSSFTLYLDNEKTGAKTYHVYFKQLSGGKITLTTGKEGAQNLVLNSGTYVAIIYVDAEGNVSNAGSTATQVIESGNTQPVESGAVANVISEEVENRNTAIENAISEITSVTTANDKTPYLRRINQNYDREVLNKIIGGSFAVNQLVQNGNFENANNWSSGIGELTVSNNIARVTYVTTGQYNQDLRQYMPYLKAGNKYLFNIEHRESTPNSSYFGFNEIDSNITFFQFPQSETWVTEQKVFAPSSVTTSYSKRISPMSDVSAYQNSWFEVRNFYIIDLNQMFGSAIADRIYDMEQSTEGSGIAWIKAYGFFTKDYYDYDTGSIISVKPSAHKISASVVYWYENRNVSTQYVVSLYAEATLKPYTNYKIYCRGAVGARVYPNEYLFSPSNSLILNGELQEITVKTLNVLPITNSTRYDDGWIIFRNHTGNTVVPNFTEFYICEEGVNADPSYSVSYPLANAELNGIPKLDSNNNLIYDGDEYFPYGLIKRKYAKVTLYSVERAYLLNSHSAGGLGWVDFNFYSVKLNTLNIILSQFGLPCKSANDGWYSTVPCISTTTDNQNNHLIRIYETSGMTEADFYSKYGNLNVVYELDTPTEDSVSAYANPQLCIKEGTEEFIDERTIPIPCGHDTDYVALPEWLSNINKFI